VHGYARVAAFEPHPRPPATLFAWIVGHLFGLLENGVNTVSGDANVVTDPENVADRDRTSAAALVQVEDALGEIVRILRVRLSSRCFHLRDLTRVAVLLGELLDASTADLELISDELRVGVVIDNTFTDPVDIVLIKLHLARSIVGEIMPTKSFAYTTCEGCEHHCPRDDDWECTVEWVQEQEDDSEFQEVLDNIEENTPY